MSDKENDRAVAVKEATAEDYEKLAIRLAHVLSVMQSCATELASIVDMSHNDKNRYLLKVIFSLLAHQKPGSEDRSDDIPF